MGGAEGSRSRARIVVVAALAIVWLSSIYPARVASRMRPIDGLRQQEK